jgi:metal-sulfur cluster biosynthetic enzyme
LNQSLSEPEVRAALSRVIHPTYGMSIVGLGMLRGVAVSEAGVEVELAMNCPGCPAGQLALGRVRQVLELLVLPGTGQVSIRLLPEVWQPQISLLIDTC